MIRWDQVDGFEWDHGNMDKNWISHKVSNSEAEQIFFNEPLIIHDDDKHSQMEQRFLAMGRTDLGRLLVIVFTLRKHFIRIISARDMSQKERKSYYEKAKENS